jgi:hypothetical protein
MTTPIARWTVGPCNACDTECVITFESRNPCSSNALVAGTEIKVYVADGHELVGTYTTDAAGKVEVEDLESGTAYIAVSRKDGSGQGSVNFAATCGGVPVVVPIASARRSIYAGGCLFTTAAVNALAGCTVTVTKSPDFWVQGTTGSDGRFYFHPPTVGTYSYIIEPPANRGLNAVTGTANVASLCTEGSLVARASMPVAAGYSCCYSDLLNSPWPVKMPLQISLSNGASGALAMSTCDGSTSLPVTVQAGGAIKSVTCPTICEYDYYPDDLGDAPVDMNVSFATIPDLRLSISARSNWVGYREGISCDNRCGTNLPFDTPKMFTSWFAGEHGLMTTGVNSTGYVINSASPLSITFSLPGSGADSGEQGVDDIGPDIRITSATVTESP